MTGDDRNTVRVSILTRTKNRPALLRRALASVRAQSFTGWEHVIINDGGDPAALEALLAREHHPARVVHHAASLGMEAASTAGLAAARGTSIIFLDDDDTWAPGCLERLVAARSAAAPDARAALCHSVEVLERLQGDIAQPESQRVWNGELQAVSLAALSVRNLFTNNAFLVDRDAVEALGGFDTGFPVYGDWDFNLRFFGRYDAAIVPEALALYHRRVQAQGAQQNSFDQSAGAAARSRARLVRLWLAGEGGRNPAVGQLLALGEHLDAQTAAAARIDKVLNALHRVRRFGPLAALGRAFGGFSAD